MIRKAYVYSTEDAAQAPPTFTFIMGVAEVDSLAHGRVPPTIRDQAVRMVAWSEEDIEADAQREQPSRSRTAKRRDAKGAQAERGPRGAAGEERRA